MSVKTTSEELCDLCARSAKPIGGIRDELAALRHYTTTTVLINDRSQRCPLCRVLKCKLGDFGGQVEVERAVKVRSELKSNESDENTSLYLNISWNGLPLFDVCILWKHQWVVPGNFPQYRTLSENSSLQSRNERDLCLLDYEFIKNWVRGCHKEHLNCDSIIATRFSQELEIIVIDVIQQRLVKVKSSCRYLALSYVRGGVTMLQTTRDNLAELMAENSLWAHRECLSRTLLDAMELTRQVDENYLWCDVLSIVQDDRVHKHSMLAAMDIIYSQAYFTIAALDGPTSNWGLPGVSRIFETERAVGNTAEVSFIAQPPILSRALPSTIYETRGWTLQERMLSRRCLYFTEKAVYAYCSKETRYLNDRGGIVTVTNLKKGWDGEEHSANGHPITNYDELVQMYTRRDLSYPEDILDAFSGIAIQQTTIYKPGAPRGNFVHGIPEDFFHIALFWEPQDVLQRRRGSSVKGQYFPSWSWIGWIGPVHPLSNNFLANWKARGEYPEIEYVHISRPFVELKNGEFALLNMPSKIAKRYLLAADIPGSSTYYFKEVDPLSWDSNVDLWLNYQKAIEEEGLTPTFQPGVLHFEAELIEDSHFFIREDRIYHTIAFDDWESRLPQNSNLNDVYTISSGPTDFCGLLFNSGITTPKSRTTRRSFVAIYVHESKGANIQEIHRQHMLGILKPTQRGSSWPAYMQTKFFRRVGLDSQKTEVVGVLCYVMLIEWRGEFAERLAIGVIRYDVWMSIAERRKEYIRLG
jgi:hypothetical protein